MNSFRWILSIAAAAGTLLAQPVSSYRYTVKGDEKIMEITNVNYELTPSDLVLRTTVHSKRELGDIGVQATATVEAWKLGVDMKQKPAYTVKVDGADVRTAGDVFMISRGLEEVEWWSVYSVASGAHLFDTDVPLVNFSVKREELTMRYMGLQTPADDVKDARLREPHVVGVLSYASGTKVIREALIACDDPKQAQLLRSFADETRTLAESGDKSKALRLSFSQNFPSPAATVSITIPIAGDDLDLAHAQLPPRLHLAAFKR